jgi:hypothetical protein
MGFGSLLGQSKFEGLTLFRDVNQERVDTVLVTVAHYKTLIRALQILR